MTEVINKPEFEMNAKVCELFDSAKIEYATDVINKFLSLLPQDKVLSSVETSLVAEAIGRAINDSFK